MQTAPGFSGISTPVVRGKSIGLSCFQASLRLNGVSAKWEVSERLQTVVDCMCEGVEAGDKSSICISEYIVFIRPRGASVFKRTISSKGRLISDRGKDAFVSLHFPPGWAVSSTL